MLHISMEWETMREKTLLTPQVGPVRPRCPPATLNSSAAGSRARTLLLRLLQ